MKKLSILNQNRILMIICFCVFFGSCSCSEEKSFNKFANSGFTNFAKHEYRKSFQDWKKAYEIQPNNVSIIENLGQVCLKLARFKDAEEYFKKAISLNKYSLNSLIEIGKLKLLLFDLKDGEKIAKIITKIDKKNINTNIYLGDLSMLKNRFYQAELYYRHALKKSPNNVNCLIKLVLSLQSQKKESQAEEVFKTLEYNNITDPIEWIQIGNYMILKDKLVKAEKCMNEAIELDSADLRIRLYVSNFYSSIGKYKKAALILESFANRESFVISKEYASSLIRLYRINDALKIIQELIKENGNDYILRMMEAKCHLLSGKFGLAARELNYVTEKIPNSPAAHYLLGIAYLSSGYHKIGVKSLFRALALDKNFAEAELAIAAYYYKINEFTLVHKYIKRIISYDPFNYKAYLINGAAYLQEGKTSEAKNFFLMSENYNNDLYVSHFLCALADEYAGKICNAKKNYEYLLDRNFNSIDILEQYISMLIKNNQVETAKKYIEKNIGKEYENTYISCLLGDFYNSINRTEKAINAYKNAIEMKSKITLPYYRLSKLYKDNDRFQDAVQILKEAVAMDLTDTNGYIEIAQLFYDLGMKIEVIKILKSAYGLNNNDGIIMNNLSAIYLEMDKNINVALEMAKKAYEINSNDPAYMDTLGWAYFKKGMYTQAIWYLNKAENKIQELCGINNENKIQNIDISNNEREKLSVVKFHLGMVLINSGKENDGVNELKNAIELGIDEKMRDKAMMEINRERTLEKL